MPRRTSQSPGPVRRPNKFGEAERGAVRAVRAATAALDGTGAADEEVDSDEYGAVNASAVNATRRRLERAVAIGARLALGAPGALDRAAGDRIVRIGELRAELGALTGAM